VPKLLCPCKKSPSKYLNHIGKLQGFSVPNSKSLFEHFLPDGHHKTGVYNDHLSMQKMTIGQITRQ